MAQVFLIVEGPSEEKFYKEIFADYFNPNHFFEVTIIPNKKNAYSRQKKGGSVSYDKTLQSIKRFLSEASHCDYVILILDYYGLHETFLEGYTGTDELEHKTNYIIERLKYEVNNPRFRFFLQVHEFEAFLFSDVQKIADHFQKSDLESYFKAILDSFDNNPELINNSKETAPSQRIYNQIPNFGKILDGNSIARKIGIQKIRDQCPRFNSFCSLFD
ncbi:MAG: DUF4276 family protein [Candidatus Woesearchaeota archaeon]